MKKLIPILVFLIMVGHSYAQIRLLEVDPVNDVVTVKNFGGSTMDISSYWFCKRFNYTALNTLIIESGILNLASGATVVLSGVSLNNTSSDLGLYSTTAFADFNAMVDFTQWGGASGFLSRESVAVDKGIWNAGDFIVGNAPYFYTGDGIQNKLPFWQATLTISTETDIVSYSFTEQTVAADIEPGIHTIDIEVAFGTDVTDLVATFSLSAGATASINSTGQESGVTSNDFSNPVTYTITAEDETMQNWTVMVTTVPNDQADILSFSFSEQTGPATINATTHSVDIEVTQGTDVTALVATFTLSENATTEVNSVSQISAETPNDFTDPVVYRITAEDGITIIEWTVTVPNTETDILTFSFEEQTGPADISPTEHTVNIEVAPGTDATNLVATFTLSEGASAKISSVIQVSGVTSNDFSNPVMYEITPEDGSMPQNWMVTVTVELYSETDIISFSVPDQLNPAVINNTNHTIGIEIGTGTDITDLVATFELSFGASAKVNGVEQASGVTSNDFTDPVTYTITAEDGTPGPDWVVTVEVILNDEADILSFGFSEQSNPANINGTDHTIDIEVTVGTDRSNLIATYTLSSGATAEVNSTAQVNGTSVNDFTSPVNYTVSAEDGVTIQDWLITVTFDPQTDILTFSFPEQTGLVLVNPSNHTVFIEVAPETNLTNLVASFTLSPGATAEINSVLQISGSTANDFTNPVTYTIISSGATFTQEWLVTVSLALSTETDFLFFSFTEQSGSAIINADNHTIQIEVAFATELAGLVATFSLSVGASASVNNGSQQSGVTANDFTNTVTYTVTAEDGTTQDWTVTVNISPNTETDFLSFNFAEQSDPAVVDSENHTVNIEVVFGTDLTVLAATFTLSPGARAEVNSIVQESGVTVNDFANPVTYRIIAGDNLTFQDWVVTVNTALNTETDILSFSFAEQTNPAEINSANHIIDTELEFGTDRTKLAATFTLSEGASARVNGVIQVSGVTENDFSDPVIYTITAEDGTTMQDWSVCTTLAPNTETEILAFSFPEQTGTAIINSNSHQIEIEIDANADITKLIATFSLSEGATAEVNGAVQESGVSANDFRAPVIYTVKAQDGISGQDWQVTVDQVVTGISDELPIEGINIFPNPVRNVLFVDIENDFTGLMVINLIDLTGKTIHYQKLAKNQRRIILSVDIISGSQLYIIHIRQGDNVFSKRILRK